MRKRRGLDLPRIFRDSFIDDKKTGTEISQCKCRGKGTRGGNPQAQRQEVWEVSESGTVTVRSHLQGHVRQNADTALKERSHRCTVRMNRLLDALAYARDRGKRSSATCNDTYTTQRSNKRQTVEHALHCPQLGSPFHLDPRTKQRLHSAESASHHVKSYESAFAILAPYPPQRRKRHN